MKVYETWLNVALQAAEEAGAVLKQQWRQTHAVHWKGFRDIVTETDMAVEKIILGRLREAFPDHAVTSEEAGADAESTAVRWLVDPLDGTTNFSRNNPNFSTSIAAVDGDQVVVGVVLDPLRGHVFAAQKGDGATLNGAPIHTSEVTELSAAILGIDSPREPALRHEMWERVGAAPAPRADDARTGFRRAQYGLRRRRMDRYLYGHPSLSLGPRRRRPDRAGSGWLCWHRRRRTVDAVPPRSADNGNAGPGRSVPRALRRGK